MLDAALFLSDLHLVYPKVGGEVCSLNLFFLTTIIVSLGNLIALENRRIIKPCSSRPDPVSLSSKRWLLFAGR